MRVFPSWNPFSGTKATSYAADCPPEPSETSRHNAQPDELDTDRSSDDPNTRRWKKPRARKPTDLFPHTLITSDLGTWGHTYSLRFNHMLAEDTSIALFSEAQMVFAPSGWRNNDNRGRSGLSFRCHWCGCSLDICSPCTARMTVGSGAEYKIPSKLIRYWDAPARLLLVDWPDLYDLYFAQEKKSMKKTGASSIEMDPLVERGSDAFGDMRYGEPLFPGITFGGDYGSRTNLSHCESSERGLLLD